MIRLFRSGDLQRNFEADGFVTLPVLTRDELEAVKQHCSLVAGDRVGRSAYRGLYVGMLDEEDVARRTAIIQEVHNLLGDALWRTMYTARLLIGQYLIKPGNAPHTVPHQDPTMTDTESSPFPSLTAWIALRDITLESGALGVIKGSHRFSTRVIATPISVFRALAHGHEAMLFRYLTFVPVKAGDAVVFDTRAIHGAMPNVTSEPRAVAAVRITPLAAPLYQFFVKPGTTDRLLKLRVSEDFLVRYRPQELHRMYAEGSIPEPSHVEGELMDDFMPLERDEMEALCRRHGAQDNGVHIVA